MIWMRVFGCCYKKKKKRVQLMYSSNLPLSMPKASLPLFPHNKLHLHGKGIGSRFPSMNVKLVGACKYFNSNWFANWMSTTVQPRYNETGCSEIMDTVRTSLMWSRFIRFSVTNIAIESTENGSLQLCFFFTAWYVPGQCYLSALTFST